MLHCAISVQQRAPGARPHLIDWGAATPASVPEHSDQPKHQAVDVRMLPQT